MEKNQQEQQEMLFKLSMFEQKIQQLQQQLQAVEQGTIELNSLNLGLDEIKGKKEKEIFALIGRGIFAKAKLISEDLIVEVGEKKFVKKKTFDIFSRVRRHPTPKISEIFFSNTSLTRFGRHVGQVWYGVI